MQMIGSIDVDLSFDSRSLFEEAISGKSVLYFISMGDEGHMDGANYEAQVGFTSRKDWVLMFAICNHIRPFVSFTVGVTCMGRFGSRYLAPFLPRQSYVKTGGEGSLSLQFFSSYGSASHSSNFPTPTFAMMGGEGLTNATK